MPVGLHVSRFGSSVLSVAAVATAVIVGIATGGMADIVAAFWLTGFSAGSVGGGLNAALNGGDAFDVIFGAGMGGMIGGWTSLATMGLTSLINNIKAPTGWGLAPGTVDGYGKSWLYTTLGDFFTGGPLINGVSNSMLGSGITGGLAGSSASQLVYLTGSGQQDYIWGEMSICTKDEMPGFRIVGHAWIELEDLNGNITTYSFWPGESVTTNYEINYVADVKKTLTITKQQFDQIQKLNVCVSKVAYSYVIANCADYSSFIWLGVTGEYLSPYWNNIPIAAPSYLKKS